MKGKRPADPQALEDSFTKAGRWTVSGLRLGGICFECECRILEIGGEEGITLAWCDCDLPEDHHEMELL
jgi:hypothetical protein